MKNSKLNVEKLKTELSKENRDLIQNLLIQTSIHSDHDKALLSAIGNISQQIHEMEAVINYFIKKERL